MRVWRYIVTMLAFTGFCTANTRPAFTGTYPASVDFAEGTANGVVLYTFTVTDAEGVDPTLSYTYSPASSSALFTITEATPTAGTKTAEVQIETGYVFNYETTKTYVITATANDGLIDSLAAAVTIEVTDVGEAPTLSPAITEQNFSIFESALGTDVGSPSVTVVDLDENEVHTWAITGGTGQAYFSVESLLGTLRLKADYDRDVVGTPASVYVDLSITDKYGLSIPYKYNVEVADLNDNTPTFETSIYNITLDSTNVTGTVVGVLNATDNDATSPNNDVTYQIVSSDVADYFAIDGTSVNLTYLFDAPRESGPYTFHVIAVDGGSSALTSTATFSLYTVASTTTTTTTTMVPPAEDAFASGSSTPILIIVAAILGACILGYILMMCWRWHTFGKCLPTSCPNSHDCRMAFDKCCTCCPDEEDEDLDSVGDASDIFTTMKKQPLSGPTVSADSIRDSYYTKGVQPLSRVTSVRS